MAEKDVIKKAMQRVEGHLKEGPNKAEAAIKELGELQQMGSLDPRVMVYQALAMNFLGKKKEAVEFAKTALSVSKDIQVEAQAIIDKLGK
jgi:hypothetical protein